MASTVSSANSIPQSLIVHFPRPEEDVAQILTTIGVPAPRSAPAAAQPFPVAGPHERSSHPWPAPAGAWHAGSAPGWQPLGYVAADGRTGWAPGPRALPSESTSAAFTARVEAIAANAGRET